MLFAMNDLSGNEQRSIMAYDLTTGRVKSLIKQGTYPRYAKTGHLLFVHESTLMAAPFNAKTLEVTGPSTPIRTGIKMASYLGASDYAISDDGTLIVFTNEEVPGLIPARIDLKGVSQPVTRHSQPFIRIRLAPDGTKAVVVISESNIFETSIWILDFERDLLTKLTPEDGNQFYPIFSNDSEWVYYTQWFSTRIIFDGLFRRRVDGAGEPEKLAIDTTRSLDEINIQLDNFSPDGQTLYLSLASDKFATSLLPPMDIYTLTLDDEFKLEPLIATPSYEMDAAPSPDGQWLAYVSDESGVRQVYIRPIDGRGARVQVSRDGGQSPAWSPDGSILYFRTRSRMISGAPISVSDEPDDTPIAQVGAISSLFHTNSPYSFFDLYPDGEHILMLTPGQREVEDRTEIKVTLNFFEELNRLVPTEPRP